MYLKQLLHCPALYYTNSYKEFPPLNNKYTTLDGIRSTVAEGRLFSVHNSTTKPLRLDLIKQVYVLIFTILYLLNVTPRASAPHPTVVSFVKKRATQFVIAKIIIRIPVISVDRNARVSTCSYLILSLQHHLSCIDRVPYFH